MSTKNQEFETLCEAAARDGNLVPDAHMDYEDWLDWTGRDDSFVGSPEQGIPGTSDLYEAVERLLERQAAPKV